MLSEAAHFIRVSVVAATFWSAVPACAATDLAGELENGAAARALPYATFSVTGDAKHIDPGLTDTSFAICPAPNVLVGGGYRTYSALVDVFGQRQQKTGGWTWAAVNNSVVSQQVNGTAVCLVNAPGATVIQEHGQIEVAAGATELVGVTCPAGSIVTGGGFYDDSQGDLQVTDSHMAGAREGWQAGAHNPAGSTVTLHVYALCLSGISGSTRQVAESADFSAGHYTIALTPTCDDDELLTSGGFSADVGVGVSWSTGPSSNDWQVTASGTIGQTIHAYATCVTLGIFLDGFESGNTSMWSSTVP